MWSTTTPPRATTSVPPSPSAASTTRSITAWSRTTRVSTSTSPAPAIRSTSAIPTRCAWSWTRCATGSSEMHVDGFRFDLAPALARETFDVDREGSFFDAIHQDPVLAGVKLIAEPWDIGENGYHVGQIPHRLVGMERQVPRRRSATSGVATRAGSPTWAIASPAPPISTRRTGGNPIASINFVTAHDGFTLHDLVSYDDKHNWANGEDNRDGSDDNISCNYGHRGPDRRRGDSGRARPAAAELSRHALPVAGHADAPRW